MGKVEELPRQDQVEEQADDLSCQDQVEEQADDRPENRGIDEQDQTETDKQTDTSNTPENEPHDPDPEPEPKPAKPVDYTYKPVSRKDPKYKESKGLLNWLFPAEPDEIIDAALGQVGYNPTAAGQLIKEWQVDNVIGEIVERFQEASLADPESESATDDEDDGKIDFLQNIYPAVARSELWERLSSADGDMQKVIDEMEAESRLSSQLDPSLGQHSEQARFLKESFPHVDVETIEKMLADNGGDAAKTTDELLSAEMLDAERADSTGRRKGKPKSNKSKPEIVQKNEIEVVASCLNVDADEARRIYQANGQSIIKSIGPDALTLAEVAAEAASRRRYTSKAAASTTTTVPAANAWSKPLDTHSHVSDHMSTSEVQDRLGVVTEQRQHAIQKIHEMRQKISRNPAYAMALSVYAERVSAYAGDMRELSDELWERKLETQSDRYVIDYHGIPLKTATDTIALKVHNWWTWKQSQIAPTPPLKIITGAGRHSAGGIPVVKNAIRKYLRENQWSYEESSSFFLVHGPKRRAVR